MLTRENGECDCVARHCDLFETMRPGMDLFLRRRTNGRNISNVAGLLYSSLYKNRGWLASLQLRQNAWFKHSDLNNIVVVYRIMVNVIVAEWRRQAGNSHGWKVDDWFGEGLILRYICFFNLIWAENNMFSNIISRLYNWVSGHSCFSAAGRNIFVLLHCWGTWTTGPSQIGQCFHFEMEWVGWHSWRSGTYEDIQLDCLHENLSELF